ncbi:NAD(+)/NADH kinase [Candidatus Poriferisodalis sp.]|uniref:NAD(+)/NADH kinase n=1 Tax=Candidatus Poriferisodalis sp. TaxID=3101277 RepID=UPI003B52A821
MERPPGNTVGIVANPLAGKDLRRLTSGATPVSDAVKIGAIRRAVVGAMEGGANRVLISGDRARLGERALAGLRLPRIGEGSGSAVAHAEVLAAHGWHTGRDSQLTAAQFRDQGVGAVIALGGDGTQRDVTKGWRDVPLVPLAVGTNNVFPLQLEATVAGFAAGAMASGWAGVADVTSQAKIIDVTVEGSPQADVALVDVCLVRGSFVGARAVWESASVCEIVAAIAEPDSVGLSAIAAAVAPVRRHEAGAAHVRLGCTPGSESAPGDKRIRAAVMPGSYSDIDIALCERLAFGQPVTLRGPGVLALDGEREIVLGAGERATITVNPDGPHVIDVGAAVAAAQRRRYPFSPAPAGRGDLDGR